MADEERKPEEYVPTLLRPGYGLVMVNVQSCARCTCWMMPKVPAWMERHLFPCYYLANADAQLKRAGWRWESGATNENGLKLCEDCIEHASFECALCERVVVGEPQEIIGYPAEYLCRGCYETVPAKVWVEKDAELHKEHRYDFE